MAKVTVRYWAAAKQAAGAAEETLSADTPEQALAAVVARRESGGELQAVLARSSFLVDGEHVSARGLAAVALHDGAVIEVLPPFAGG